uniref:Uncharacterized protein n=1 Tax=Panagrolaimus sp. ES5 TaxID=591445 RepID=A0AC34FLL9_9BILA
METNGGHVPLQGQILPHLIKEAANNGLEIHHEKEESNERQVQNMIENYKSHLLQQQKSKATATSQQIRQFMPTTIPSGPPPPTSHSHPCLFTIDSGNMKHTGRTSDEANRQISPNFQQGHSFDQRDFYEPNFSHNPPPTFYHEASVPLNPSNTVVLTVADITAIKAEGELMRRKVETLEQKVARLRQLEQAYDRIEKEFEHVLNQREQQEQMEKQAYNKLEHHMQKLAAENAALIQRLEGFGSHQSVPQESQPDSNMQVAQLTMLLNEYVAQNKELQVRQERQKVELEAHIVTLNEQRNHIDMLEKALTNAQEKLATKDRQLQDYNNVVERCNHVQKLLQDTTDDRKRRHDEYMKEKAHLEMQLAQAKMQIANPSPRKNRTSPEPEENSRLRRVLASKEEKIGQLEAILLQLQKKYGDDAQRKEMTLKSEIEAQHVRYRNLELEKLEKDRKIQELLNENRRMQEKLSDDRLTNERRFSMLENDIRRLANNHHRASTSTTALYNGTLSRQFPPPFTTSTPIGPPPPSLTAVHAAATTLSTSSLNNYESEPMFIRPQRPASVDPAMRMEEMRRNIAERRNHQQRSYSRPRLAPTTAPPPIPDSRGGGRSDESHNRASSGPSSVIYSTGVKSPPGFDGAAVSKDQSEIERQIAEYMASLPAETRRRFVAATGLNKTDFTTNYPIIQHSTTPSLPEGAKLSLMRQGSKSSNKSTSSKKQQSQKQQQQQISHHQNEESPPPFSESHHGVRIHLTEPSTDAKLQDPPQPDHDELHSPPTSDDEEADDDNHNADEDDESVEEPDEPQTPASGMSASSYQPRHQHQHGQQQQNLYQYEIQPPQSHTQIHTTTVVEVNKEQISTPHRSHLRSKNPQKHLSHQSNSLGADPTGLMSSSAASGSGFPSRFSESPTK